MWQLLFWISLAEILLSPTVINMDKKDREPGDFGLDPLNVCRVRYDSLQTIDTDILFWCCLEMFQTCAWQKIWGWLLRSYHERVHTESKISDHCFVVACTPSQSVSRRITLRNVN